MSVEELIQVAGAITLIVTLWIYVSAITEEADERKRNGNITEMPCDKTKCSECFLPCEEHSKEYLD